MYDKTEIINRLDILGFYQGQIERLGKAKSNGWAQGLCCFHPEENPSLSVNVKTGAFTCHACEEKGDLFSFYEKKFGCDFKTAISELAKLAGVNGDKSKRAAKKKNGPKVCEYIYTDEKGNYRFQVNRHRDPKTFIQCHKDNTGKIVWDMNGVETVLYNLPDVERAKEVFDFEGEKDAGLARKMGFVSTCNPGGAGKWKPTYNEYLEDKIVYLIADNDEPGIKHMEQVGSQLLGVAEQVKIIELPGLGPVL